MIDVQGGDRKGAWNTGEEGFDVAAAQERSHIMVQNAKKVLDVFRAEGLPVIQFKEVHRKNFVDFGRELDGAEGPHLLEDDPHTDYAHLTYSIEGEYCFTKRRYSCSLLIPIGGGSCIDTAKCIAGAMVHNEETHEKKQLLHPDVFPKYSLLDPEYTYSVHRKQTTFGVNVLDLEPSEDKYETANRAIDTLENLFRSWGSPKNLRESGIGLTDDSKFEIMAEKAIGAAGKINGCVPLSKEDVINIYKAAF